MRTGFELTKPTERIAAFRDVLRHLGHPERLYHNHLVASQFRTGRDPAAAAARIQHIIESALDDLPKRQRDIIRRCDLQGEAHTAVISALAVSERHFYRERLCAFEAVSAVLARAAQTVTAPPYNERHDAVAIQLSFADAAHQTGDMSAALRVLGAACRNTADRSVRINLECRLAELCCEAGMVAAASGHIAVARQLACDLEEASDVTAARIDAVEATAAWRFGESELSVQRAERAAATMRRELERHSAARDAEALALALIVLSEKDIALGKVAAARRKAMEAHTAITSCDSIRAVLAMRVQWVATAAYMFDPVHLNDAAFELNQQYRHAIAFCITLEATLIGWRLSHFHRFANAPERAVKALRELLPIARQVLTDEERASLCLDLASNYVACGKPANAQRMIREAQAHAFPGGFAAAFADVVAADAYLAEGEFHEALRLSRAAGDAMHRLGRPASVGSALRVQADAKHALGDVRTATRLIGAALSHLDGLGHPSSVAKAHRSAARITGNRKHRRIADEIAVKLRPATV